MTRLDTPILDHIHPKYFWSVFNFCEFVLTCKKSVYSICSFFKYRVPSPDWPHPFSTMPTPKIFKHLLICLNWSLICMQKNLLIPSVYSRYTVNFKLQRPDCLLLPVPNQKIFDQLFFVNLYQNAKKEAVSSICFGERVDLKILQSNWLRAFWSTSQQQDFSQV